MLVNFVFLKFLLEVERKILFKYFLFRPYYNFRKREKHMSTNLSGLTNMLGGSGGLSALSGGLGGGSGSMDASGAMSSGMQAMSSIMTLLASDEAQQAVGDTLTFGVEGGKLMASLFGMDLSGLDSQQIGQMGGSLFGSAADMGQSLFSQMGSSSS